MLLMPEEAAMKSTLPPAGLALHASALSSLVATLCDALPPALDGEALDTSEIDADLREAVQRDRAKLAAPPLPSLPSAPAPG